MTDIPVLLYGFPQDLDRWENEFKGLRRRNPGMQDSPTLTEIRPRLLRFHQADRWVVLRFLEHYNPEGQRKHFQKNIAFFDFLLGLFRRLAGRRWKSAPVLKNAGQDFENGLKDVSVVLLAEGADDYEWGY